MASATGAAGIAVEVTRIFSAQRERVWEAWTQPEQLARWMCRTGGDGTVRVLHVDLRAGGGFAVEAQGANGPLHHLDCVYREVLAPEKLAFTWKWRGDEEESLVRVEFREDKASGGTEVRLRHSQFASEKSRDGHGWGWHACFDALDAALKHV